MFGNGQRLQKPNVDMIQLHWGVKSITGQFRENNEDNFVVDPDGRYFLVCDGMGGQSAGEKASELATEAGVTQQTASAHLGKLKAGGLVRQRKQGRHRYFSLADDDVGSLLENMMGLAAKKGHSRTRTGPKEPALRKSRVCYNHLAGELGVEMFDCLLARKFLVEDGDNLALTASGRSFVTQFGVDIDSLNKSRRPLCKSCLDWSARRSHLAGSLGAALLERFYQLGWARRVDGTRVVAFTKQGEAKFLANFSV